MNKQYILKTDRSLKTHNVAMLLARQKTMSDKEFMKFLKERYNPEQIKEVFDLVDKHQAGEKLNYGRVI